MRKVLSIIGKDFRLILRSRISALIILFGPLLIMLIVGLAFNSASTLRINVGHYAPEYNNLTSSFTEILQKTNYKIAGYESKESCKNAIFTGEAHICVIFPENFTISNNRVNEIVFLVDNSKVNLYEAVVDSIEQDFNTRALELTRGMTSELLTKLNETQESIQEKTSVVSSLQENNAQLKKDITKISQEIKSLDLDFDADSLEIDKLEDESDVLKETLADLEDVADDAINEAEALIDDVGDEVADLNLTTSERNAITDLLNASQTEIDTLKSTLNSTEELNTTIIDKIVGRLKTDLREVENQFNSASRARDVTAEKAENIKAKLDESLARINIVEETFTGIYSNIAVTEITDLQAITQPIVKKVEPVAVGEGVLSFFFPYLVVLIVMFIGLLLSSTLVIMEKTSRAHFRNFVTPTSDIVFILGAYMTSIIILTIQLIVLLGLFSLVFGKDIMTNLQTLVLLLFLLISFFSFIGMGIGYLFNTEETGTLASISLGSILLFVSDLIFPLERMPERVADIASTYNPFIIGSELLRKALIHHMSPGDLSQGIVMLLIYSAAAFILMVIIHKFSKRTFLLRWAGYVARKELKKQEKLEAQQEKLSRYGNLQEKDYFKTENISIGSFEGLVSYIDELEDASFKKIVNKDKNLIADWVENTLKNQDLAEELKGTTSKKKTMKILKDAGKQYGDLKDRMEKVGHESKKSQK